MFLDGGGESSHGSRCDRAATWAQWAAQTTSSGPLKSVASRVAIAWGRGAWHFAAMKRFALLAPALVLSIMFSGCKDTQDNTAVVPVCEPVHSDTRDYWDAGTCTNGSYSLPCCPTKLPSCDADAGYPACVKSAESKSICVCCDGSWTCVSEGHD